jgi:hypothetical protein
MDEETLLFVKSPHAQWLEGHKRVRKICDFSEGIYCHFQTATI